MFEAFNRGWARYRLLQAGSYRVQLDYTPAWDDEDLRRRHVGRVQSNALRIEIKESAPPVVRRDGRPIVAELKQRQGKLTAELLCTSDVPIHVNLGLGPRLGPDAQLTWIVRTKGRMIELKRTGQRQVKPVASAPAATQFRRCVAGDRMVVATLRVADLFADQLLEAVKPGEEITVQARYINLLSRSFLRGGPKGGRKELLPSGMTIDEYAATLPARVYTGKAITNAIDLTKPR